VAREALPKIGSEFHHSAVWLSNLCAFSVMAVIRLRDQDTCRTFCGAPIRHLDHITRHTDGGATSYNNGRGTCERCNYAREMPGWQITSSMPNTPTNPTP